MQYLQERSTPYVYFSLGLVISKYIEPYHWCTPQIVLTTYIVIGLSMHCHVH